MRKIQNYNTFFKAQKVNEELLTGLVSKLKSWLGPKIGQLKGWAKTFYDKLMGGEIRIGKSGKPVIMYFPASLGPVDKQLAEFTSLNASNESRVYEEAYVDTRFEDVDNVSAEELVEIIEQAYWEKCNNKASYKPVFIFGAVGIGKTEIVAQAAAKLGIDLVNLDIQNMVMEDLTGMPVAKHEIEKTVFYPRQNLPTDEGSTGKGGILFLDELNKADSDMLKKLNQFIQMGRLNEFVLPAKWLIVASGNRPQDEVDISPMDPSFVQRFTIVNYVPSIGVVASTGDIVSGWAKYVTSSPEKDVLPELIWFLIENPDQFHRQPVGSPEKIFATPRSWTFGARKLHSIILRAQEQGKNWKTWRDVPMETIKRCFVREVGAASAGGFVQFLETLTQLSDEEMKSILQGDEKVGVKKKFKDEKRFLYAVADGLMKKIPDSIVGAKRDKMLYHIFAYIAKYEQFEILSWLLKKYRTLYPVWVTGNAENDKVEGIEWREKAAKLYVEGQKKAKIK